MTGSGSAPSVATAAVASWEGLSPASVAAFRSRTRFIMLALQHMGQPVSQELT